MGNHLKQKSRLDLHYKQIKLSLSLCSLTEHQCSCLLLYVQKSLKPSSQKRRKTENTPNWNEMVQRKSWDDANKRDRSSKRSRNLSRRHVLLNDYAHCFCYNHNKFNSQFDQLYAQLQSLNHHLCNNKKASLLILFSSTFFNLDICSHVMGFFCVFFWSPRR